MANRLDSSIKAIIDRQIAAAQSSSGSGSGGGCSCQGDEVYQDESFNPGTPLSKIGNKIGNGLFTIREDISTLFNQVIILKDFLGFVGDHDGITDAQVGGAPKYFSFKIFSTFLDLVINYFLYRVTAGNQSISFSIPVNFKKNDRFDFNTHKFNLSGFVPDFTYNFNFLQQEMREGPGAYYNFSSPYMKLFETNQAAYVAGADRITIQKNGLFSIMVHAPSYYVAGNTTFSIEIYDAANILLNTIDQFHQTGDAGGQMAANFSCYLYLKSTQYIKIKHTSLGAIQNNGSKFFHLTALTDISLTYDIYQWKDLNLSTGFNFTNARYQESNAGGILELQNGFIGVIKDCFVIITIIDKNPALNTTLSVERRTLTNQILLSKTKVYNEINASNAKSFSYAMPFFAGDRIFITPSNVTARVCPHVMVCALPMTL